MLYTRHVSFPLSIRVTASNALDGCNRRGVFYWAGHYWLPRLLLSAGLLQDMNKFSIDGANVVDCACAAAISSSPTAAARKFGKFRPRVPLLTPKTKRCFDKQNTSTVLYCCQHRDALFFEPWHAQTPSEFPHARRPQRATRGSGEEAWPLGYSRDHPTP